jgi:hypothetical protein
MMEANTLAAHRLITVAHTVMSQHGIKAAERILDDANLALICAELSREEITDEVIYVCRRYNQACEYLQELKRKRN